MFCPTCQVESGPTLFCHVCDNYLPDTQTGIKAGLVRRFCAVLLDDVLIWMALMTAVIIVAQCLSTSALVRQTLSLPVLTLSGAALAVYLIGFFVALAHGMTPGKWAVGIRAVDKRNGMSPGLGRMFVREIIGKIVSMCFFFLGFFWAIWDKDAQAWHDKLAGTVVVRNDVNRANQPSMAWATASFVAFLLMLGLQIFPRLSPSTTAYAESPAVAPIYDTSTTKQYVKPSPLQESSTIPAVQSVPVEPALQNSEVSPTSQNEAVAPLAQEQEIAQMLHGWASAAARNNPEQESSFYAPHVDRYYLARNLSRNDVLENERTDFAKGGFASYEIDTIHFDTLNPDSALVSLMKSYTLATTGEAKRVHSRVWLTRLDEGWRISGEQDLLH